MLVALTRAISPALARCELTHLQRFPIDLERARAQHRAYEAALRSLGVHVIQLAADDAMPDSVFIEDTAIVLDELAVITRPGAASRRAETLAVHATLSACRPVVQLAAPATLDGGDVLVIGRTLYIGQSSRTNSAAIHQLQTLLGPHDYRVIPVQIAACLHLKSAATLIGPGCLLVNPQWIPPAAFPDLHQIAIDPTEPCAANALRVGDTLLFPQHYPRTRARLRDFHVLPVECDELAKAEGALTCCSLLFTAPLAPADPSSPLF